jgi:CHAT domain-containing protein
LRPPVEQRPLGPGELQPIDDSLQEFVRALEIGSSTRGGSDGNPRVTKTSAMNPMLMAGSQLFDLVIPQHARVDLRSHGLFLEIGIDEQLLNYPWELMHDGDDFLCEKHYVGRFVNVASRPIPPGEQPRAGSTLQPLSILVISVPRPQPRIAPGSQSMSYEPLPEAAAETEAIAEAVKDVKGVKLQTLIGKDATFNAVYSALKSNEFHIVHFNGHAHFSEKEPTSSGLVLFDRDMTTGPLVSFFGKRPPILSFMNACETGVHADWNSKYDVYSLARALLESGSYLVGSRWKLTDDSAHTFAKRFYTALLAEDKALGPAIKEARTECRKAVGEDDVGWASFVFYGDPRVCFRQTTSDAAH